jgi:hypothetical protein
VAALAAADGDVPHIHRERVESDLSRLLTSSGVLTSQLAVRAEHERAALARRLHNDAVASATRTRRSSQNRLRAFEMAES